MVSHLLDFPSNTCWLDYWECSYNWTATVVVACILLFYNFTNPYHGHDCSNGIASTVRIFFLDFIMSYMLKKKSTGYSCFCSGLISLHACFFLFVFSQYTMYVCSWLIKSTATTIDIQLAVNLLYIIVGNSNTGGTNHRPFGAWVGCLGQTNRLATHNFCNMSTT